MRWSNKNIPCFYRRRRRRRRRYNKAGFAKQDMTRQRISPFFSFLKTHISNSANINKKWKRQKEIVWEGEKERDKMKGSSEMKAINTN